MKKPLVSVIVISFNTRQVTIDCLDSVIRSLTFENAPAYEIILIDNASSDGSAEALREYSRKHPQIRYTGNTENIGFGRANNQGVKLAEGEYVLLLNSDTVTLDHAISDLLAYFQQHEEIIQFVGGKLLEKDGRTPQPSCGPFYTLPVVFGALFLKGDYWGLTRSSPDTARRVDWVSGACILTKKEYYQKLHGFDEDIFMYMEEIDLLMRARKMGYRTGFYPGARFIHLGSASSGGKTYPILQVYKGFLYLYRKHYSPLALGLLKSMLQLKAAIALLIGRLRHNTYLTETYEKALTLAQMD